MRKSSQSIDIRTCKQQLKILKPNTYPELTTQRLLLRQPSMNDAAAYHSILSNEATSRYSDVPHQPTLKRSQRFVSWMSKLYPKDVGIAWILESRSTGDLLGAIRINKIEKKIRCGYLGYELDPSHWNHHYASEALGAVVDYAHSAMELNRLEAWTVEGNTASDRVLLNNGFTLEGRQRDKVYFQGRVHNINVFARLSGDSVKPS